MTAITPYGTFPSGATFPSGVTWPGVWDVAPGNVEGLVVGTDRTAFVVIGKDQRGV